MFVVNSNWGLSKFFGFSGIWWVIEFFSTYFKCRVLRNLPVDASNILTFITGNLLVVDPAYTLDLIVVLFFLGKETARHSPLMSSVCAGFFSSSLATCVFCVVLRGHFTGECPRQPYDIHVILSLSYKIIWLCDLIRI